VLVTLTTERGKFLNALHAITINGKIHFSNGIQIAQLGLKHRQNMNQQQRIVAFVGSPVLESEQDLVKLAKKLKKNGIAVDVVSFGEDIVNAAKLEAFISNVNSNDNRYTNLGFYNQVIS